VAVARVVRTADAPLRLVGCQFYPATDGAPEALLEQVVREHALDQTECVSVIDPGHFNLLLVEAPEVDAAELKAAVRWRIKDLIDFHIDDAVIDVFDIPSQRGGRTRMMYVVVAKASAVRAHIDLMEGAGLRLGTIDIPELAVRNVAALLPEDQTGVAFLQLGRDNGLLTISRGGDLFLARSLDLGVDLLAAEATGVDEEGELPERLQRLFDGIVLEVQRSLDYYESHFDLPPVSGLVIAPLGMPLPQLVRYVASNLGLPVRMADLSAVLDSETPLDDTLQARCMLAIGAALRHEEKAL
jgi:MSHA biogenesis protein MshI